MYIMLEINLSKKHLQRAGLFILVLLLIFLLRPLVAVPDGHAGVMIKQGKVQDEVVSEGIYLLMPGYQEIVNIDCRIQQLEIEVPVASHDLQTVNTLLSLHYHVNPSGVAKLYRQEGTAYETTLLTPVVQDALQSVTIRYSAKELLYKRPEIINQSFQLISHTLAQQNIAVDSFNIINFEIETPSNLIYL